ncbi:MAG TPA: type I-C CRISPR-associated protein Cas8c/Csd1 [Telmatospirillum sp.]|nr:type I-C CRISPR-associated protein Cas8c/Csd1 [Telmatospirillum sp.]
MSILASLNRAYDRLALRHDVPAFGFSSEKIGFVLSLNLDGSLAGPPIDWRDRSGKKPVPRLVPVPQPVKRTSGIAPNFLWDKTSYVLGVTAGEGKRVKDEHQAFVDFHATTLRGTQDEGLKAFLTFLEQWNPDAFDQLDWPEEIKADIKDQNVIFALERERRDVFIHDRPAAKQLWARLSSEGEKTQAVCLITGEHGPIARLHPSIKGVYGGQSSGGAIVSFNLDAFTSYGHEQGDNAPISEGAAFGYTTALNKFLEKGSENRLPIGDASVVFWADASDVKVAHDAEAAFLSFLSDVDEVAESRTHIKPILEKIRQGQPLQSIAPHLSQGVRFYVLGLAPNAARLSIRFWLEDDFGALTEHYQRFLSDMRIEPPDRDGNIALWKYLRETAVLGKGENVPPNLAGEWMRSILTGANYPLTLLSTVLMRVRADKDVNARRVSILKSILIRNFNLKSEEAPVAFDPDNRNKGYLLGRLFAVYEHVQTAALGRNVNATIKDKFYGSASAQPRKVFALLEKGSANHLSKIGKQKAGYRVVLEKQLGEILNHMSPSDDPFPTALSSEEQALFGLGYYHQRAEFFKAKTSDTTSSKDASL